MVHDWRTGKDLEGTWPEALAWYFYAGPEVNHEYLTRQPVSQLRFEQSIFQIHKSTVQALHQAVKFFITNFHQKCPILRPSTNIIHGFLYVDYWYQGRVLSEPVNLSDKKHGANDFAARVFEAGIALSVVCSDGGRKVAWWICSTSRTTSISL